MVVSVKALVSVAMMEDEVVVEKEEDEMADQVVRQSRCCGNIAGSTGDVVRAV